MCRWRMNMLVTSQYQPRLSGIAKIFSRLISQSDWKIQIKLNYIRMDPEEYRSVLNIFHVKDCTLNPTALKLGILVKVVLFFVLSENRTHSVGTLHHRCQVTYMCVSSLYFYDFPIRNWPTLWYVFVFLCHYVFFLYFFSWWNQFYRPPFRW